MQIKIQMIFEYYINIGLKYNLNSKIQVLLILNLNSATPGNL